MASVCKYGTTVGSIPASCAVASASVISHLKENVVPMSTGQSTSESNARVAADAYLIGYVGGLGAEMVDAARALEQERAAESAPLFTKSLARPEKKEHPFGFEEVQALEQNACAQCVRARQTPTYVWFYPDGVDAKGDPTKIVTPCAHSKCISKYFDLYCNGYEWKNGVMGNTVCTENPVCVNNPNPPRDMTQRYFDVASVTSRSLSDVPAELRDKIWREQVKISNQKSANEIACLIYDLSQVPVKFRDEIWLKQVKILGLNPDLKEMAELDKLRELFILKCWGVKVSIQDNSHPAHSHYPQCETDEKWARGHSVPRLSWHLASYELFKCRCAIDAAFHENLRKLNAVIRKNKKAQMYVDFLHMYPRKGCNTEFKKGFCTDLDCDKEHSTFHGDASILGITRPTLPFDQDIYNKIVGGANIKADWWRIAASPPTVAPKVVELALTESAKVRLLSEVMTWFLAGMPMLVNPRRIEDLPTNPFYSPGEWGNVAENDALPKGLEYLCIEIINWLKDEEKIVVFNEGVQTPSAIREALSKTLSNRAFAQY